MNALKILIFKLNKVSGRGNSIHNINSATKKKQKKKKMYIYTLVLEVIIIPWMRISVLRGKTWPWG